MIRKAFLTLALSCLTAQGALADCWRGNDVDAFQFLWSATVEDVEDCLHMGVDPNERNSGGSPPLYTMSVIGTKNPDGLAVIRTLVRAGGDPHLAPRRFKKFVTALYNAERTWGEDSDVVRAMRGEAPPARTAAPSSALYGAIAVAELRYTEEGQRYETPSVIAYNFDSIDAAIKRAKSSCNRDFARARAYDDYNECAVYRVFSSGFRDDGYYDSDHDGTADTRKTPGRCGVAMSTTISYTDGSEKPFWGTGAGSTRSNAIRDAMDHCRDNYPSLCNALKVRSFACNDQ